MNIKTGAALAVACGALLSVSACSKFTEPYKDARVEQRNTGPASVGTMPDGFSNFASKCDHGNRVYVVFKGDNKYGSISVVANDPSCASTR